MALIRPGKTQLEFVPYLGKAGRWVRPRGRLYLTFGGYKVGGDLAESNWIHPALFKSVDNRMRIAQEEIFGPVLSVISSHTEEEAIRIANVDRYGFTGCVYTTDVSCAFRVARRDPPAGVRNDSTASVAGGLECLFNERRVDQYSG